ncbi:hypothetical protein Ahy_B05g075531 [Arachis hypogaea]|uniref:MULE transposase domain-containing protein n=1 Tax=Arachis hypogaea TaxID=3818 RepID=A0A444Z1F5_ARAHY|nr:hypothetical protein Ahy_B05g075531 [Arachis hypogaea]
MDYYLCCLSVSTTMISRPYCALLENEKTPSYEWVFIQWVKCIGTTPQGIITDQCRSMFGAIRKTLPDTCHRWCIWHIMKKLPHKLRGYYRYRELYADLTDIMSKTYKTAHACQVRYCKVTLRALIDNSLVLGFICFVFKVSILRMTFMMTDECGFPYFSRVNFGLL